MNSALLAVDATAPIRPQIEKIIEDNKVVAFIKGSPEAPSCSFSARVCDALQESGVDFIAVDVLAEPRLRQELSSISHWPTIPQVFVDGDLIGGGDIINYLQQNGHLLAVLSGEGDEFLVHYEDNIGEG